MDKEVAQRAWVSARRLARSEGKTITTLETNITQLERQQNTLSPEEEQTLVMYRQQLRMSKSKLATLEEEERVADLSRRGQQTSSSSGVAQKNASRVTQDTTSTSNMLEDLSPLSSAGSDDEGSSGVPLKRKKKVEERSKVQPNIKKHTGKPVLYPRNGDADSQCHLRVPATRKEARQRPVLEGKVSVTRPVLRRNPPRSKGSSKTPASLPPQDDEELVVLPPEVSATAKTNTPASRVVEDRPQSNKVKELAVVEGGKELPQHRSDSKATPTKEFPITAIHGAGQAVNALRGEQDDPSKQSAAGAVDSDKTHEPDNNTSGQVETSNGMSLDESSNSVKASTPGGLEPDKVAEEPSLANGTLRTVMPVVGDSDCVMGEAKTNNQTEKVSRVDTGMDEEFAAMPPRESGCSKEDRGIDDPRAPEDVIMTDSSHNAEVNSSSIASAEALHLSPNHPPGPQSLPVNFQPPNPVAPFHAECHSGHIQLHSPGVTPAFPSNSNATPTTASNFGDGQHLDATMAISTHGAMPMDSLVHGGILSMDQQSGYITQYDTVPWGDQVAAYDLMNFANANMGMPMGANGNMNMGHFTGWEGYPMSSGDMNLLEGLGLHMPVASGSGSAGTHVLPKTEVEVIQHALRQIPNSPGQAKGVRHPLGFSPEDVKEAVRVLHERLEIPKVEPLPPSSLVMSEAMQRAWKWWVEHIFMHCQGVGPPKETSGHRNDVEKSCHMKSHETEAQYFERMERLAWYYILMFLQNAGNPDKQWIPFNLRSWVRRNAVFCPIAGTTSLELAMAFLTTYDGCIRCIYHHWAGKHYSANDKTAYQAAWDEQERVKEELAKQKEARQKEAELKRAQQQTQTKAVSASSPHHAQLPAQPSPTVQPTSTSAAAENSSGASSKASPTELPEGSVSGTLHASTEETTLGTDVARSTEQATTDPSSTATGEDSNKTQSRKVKGPSHKKGKTAGKKRKEKAAHEGDETVIDVEDDVQMVPDEEGDLGKGKGSRGGGKNKTGEEKEKQKEPKGPTIFLTGVPHEPTPPPNKTSNVPPPEGLCHCGCTVYQAVSSLLLFKTEEIVSVPLGLRQTWGAFRMNPLFREFHTALVEKYSRKDVTQHYSHVLVEEGEGVNKVLRYEHVTRRTKLERDIADLQQQLAAVELQERHEMEVEKAQAEEPEPDILKMVYGENGPDFSKPSTKDKGKGKARLN
ncbi:hypothetical protein VNI00_018860 [Paramarasmius palmivorus]|uniref:Uncharacterized protein n=1 Tax=Paramarasmius palmivorus TaxID=297713 RepID=A0AAW0AV64_9AGAR